MLKTLNTAATGMKAQETNMEVISNNIANVNTTGFKRARAEFEDLVYQNIKEPGAITGENAVSPTGVQVGLGVKTSAIQKDFGVGVPKITRNPLDLSIDGTGFFPIQLPDGQIAYSRDGSFKKDTNGRLVDRNGNALQPEIVVPPNASNVSISDSGQVLVTIPGNIEPQPIGQIELVNFINPAGLRSVGKNLYMPTISSGLPAQGVPGTNGLGGLSQGQLESSNVNIVEAMVDMIRAQRSYETNSKVIQAADQMLQSVNTMR